MIFFDLDGTLLDHDSAVRAGASRFLEVFRSDFNEDAESFFIRWKEVGERHLESVLRIEPSGAVHKGTFQGQRRGRMRDLFAADLSDAEADARFQIYLDRYEASWSLYPDVEPCLRALAGRRTGLITNGDGKQQRSKIERFGLGKFFSPIIISREVGWAKPEREIFEQAARQAGVSIGDCVYVGDRLQTDALAGQKAGMKGVWLDRKGKGTSVDDGVVVIRSLSELPGVLDA